MLLEGEWSTKWVLRKALGEDLGVNLAALRCTQRARNALFMVVSLIMFPRGLAL